MNIEVLTEEEKVALRKRFDDLVLAVEQTPEPPLPLACILKVGGVRHGLVFRSFREGREIWFELENPECEPCPDQRMLDERFHEDLEATS